MINFQPTIDHRIVASFTEYINYKLLEKGRGFSVVSTGFYRQTGVQNTQVTAYSSPYKQFVYDNSVSGVQVMTGVSGNGNFYNSGSGLVVDYNRGRILFPTNPSVAQFSGTFTLKDINVKVTTKAVEDLLKNTKYVQQPIAPQVVTGVKENVETYPIVYINYIPGKNVGRALGGMDNSLFTFECLAVMNSPYLLDGVLGVLRDLNQTQVGIFENSELPLNISGGLKVAGYSYTGTVASKTWPNAFHIETVETTKADWEINNDFGQDIYIGEIVFNCGLSRYPRQ